MKTRETTPGKWYAVTSASGCTVTFETKGGTVTLEMKAPQDVFCAVGGSVSISDDSASLTQTFNLAPSFFKAARGWGQDPIWFKSLHAVLTRLLDGTQFEMVLTEQGSKLVVHTDRVADDLLEQVRTTAEAYLPAGVELVRYNHHMEISWRDINKYAECTNYADLLAVNPDYATDVTSDGQWVYPLSKLKTTYLTDFSGAFGLTTATEWIMTLPELTDASNFFEISWEKGAASLKRVVLHLPKATNLGWMCCGCSQLESFEIHLSGQNVTYGSSLAGECPKLKRLLITGGGSLDMYFLCTRSAAIEEVEVYAEKIVRIHEWFYYNSKLKRVVLSNTKHIESGTVAYQGCVALEEFPTSYPALSSANDMFTGCRIKGWQAIEVLNSIPSYSSGTHKITMGIHVDHKNDEEVLAAIANAEAKGWTLTVQWNGTPTAAASTYGRGQLIFAKVAEHELPDGTTERTLDWGHYVTDETGYETFRSLESAYEYFGLPMPEESFSQRQQNDEISTN